MTSNEIGGIAWGITVASWVAHHYGTDATPFIMMALVASIIVFLTTGYNWGKWIQKKRMKQESNDVISRTGEEGVFLQPTGSHETDPFATRTE